MANGSVWILDVKNEYPAQRRSRYLVTVKNGNGAK
jgi:hypothetical protein